MSLEKAPDRCRIVLIAPDGASIDGFAADLRKAISGGDIASLILPAYGMDEVAFQKFAEPAAEIAQAAGIAVIIAGDSRVAGRVKADGIHVETKAELEDAIERFQSRMAVGVGGAKTRDDALDLGEYRPDYLFFGRFGYDNTPQPHPRNLSLGQWWAEMIEIPCIVMAGSDIASVETVGATGADFVALSRSVFGEGIDPAEAIAKANAMLDATAPRFSEQQ